MGEQPQDPKAILEQARAARRTAGESRTAETARVLQQGLARRQELQQGTTFDTQQLGAFDVAIREVGDDIKEITDAKQPVPEALEHALTKLQQGRNTLMTKLEAAQSELVQLEGREDIQTYVQQERKEAAAKERRAQKAEELTELEKEMNEVLRLEQEVNGTGRLLTELWKQDNGWALGFQGEEIGSLKDDHALLQQLEAINQAKEKLKALEGKWFKNKDRSVLEAQIVQDPTIQQQRKELNARRSALYGESQRLQDELQTKLTALYSALERIQKIQRQQREDYNNSPPSAEALIQAKFPFVGIVHGYGKRFDVKFNTLFKNYGYER